ncbi:galactokinase [Marinimicrobium koreense]|uniref:Galactokinase n=1 Tax=Marinimicrobium koreense TaxID=306545 RepID=A0A3N1P102_9GAMM|nr:galactokinase [Marinimicrobium koreense]ROQ21719.1 galactokinase [Marinimicrobium koreense]
MAEFNKLAQAFEYYFQCAPDVMTRAPGRVNLIGEHTDYNQGFVFPAAINFGTDVAVGRRDDRIISAVAMDYSGATSYFSMDDIRFDQAQPWSNYVRGVLKVLSETYDFNGVNMIITGNVPQGAGLSSSASLEIAVLKAVASLYKLPLSGVEAALIGQRAENEFVGCSCGIMDQLISALGKAGNALLLDCQSLAYEYHPINPDYQVVIVNSNVKRGLVDSEYNLRREQCEEAASLLGVESLRAATMDQLYAGRERMSDPVFRRARHVISENDRTLAMGRALEESDYRIVSQLMAESHRSMREDFEITIEPVDTLVAIIDEVIGTQGGVRMTGGGFGGCVVALVPKELVPSVENAVSVEYHARTGIRESLYICTAEQGAFSETSLDENC